MTARFLRPAGLGAALVLALVGPGARADDAPQPSSAEGEYREADPKQLPPPPEEVHREGEYGGVAPGQPRSGKPRKPPSKPTVTWIGFQELDAGSSRIFLQLSGPATFQQAVAGGELVVTISEFKLGPRNHTRPLDTKFFETAIASVSAKSVKGQRKKKGPKSPPGVEVRVQFKDAADARQADARVEQAQDGFHYLYLDFGPPAKKGS